MISLTLLLLISLLLHHGAANLASPFLPSGAATSERLRGASTHQATTDDNVIIRMLKPSGGKEKRNAKEPKKGKAKEPKKTKNDPKPLAIPTSCQVLDDYPKKNLLFCNEKAGELYVCHSDPQTNTFNNLCLSSNDIPALLTDNPKDYCGKCCLPTCNPETDYCGKCCMPACDQGTEVCVNEGSISPSCECAEGHYKNEIGICVAYSPEELAVLRALELANPDVPAGIFPQEVIQQIVADFPMVPGTATFESAFADSSPVFLLPEGSLSSSSIVAGTYTPPGGSTIPGDLEARLYFQDGLRASSSVDPSSGSFTLVVNDVPFGFIPGIVIFVSESYNEDGQRQLDQIENPGPVICICDNREPCGPAFSLTLTWDQPTSDVDLHVYEPGGAHVYYNSKIGANGAYLDFDDTEGFGPEHYYAPTTLFTGTNYQIQVEMWSYHEDVGVDVNWKLQGHSFGSLLWTVTGRFNSLEQDTQSDLIPWIFEEQPVCERDICNSCDTFDVTGSRRHLALFGPRCDGIPAPSTWKALEDPEKIMGIFYCTYEHNKVRNLEAASDGLNRLASCFRDYLTDEQKNNIIASVGINNKDEATALKVARAVREEFKEERDWILGLRYVCRHHALALYSVLQTMGFSATVEAAVSWVFSWPHTWTEAVINGDRYIFDAYNNVYIHVTK